MRIRIRVGLELSNHRQHVEEQPTDRVGGVSWSDPPKLSFAFRLVSSSKMPRGSGAEGLEVAGNSSGHPRRIDGRGVPVVTDWSQKPRSWNAPAGSLITLGSLCSVRIEVGRQPSIFGCRVVRDLLICRVVGSMAESGVVV